MTPHTSEHAAVGAVLDRYVDAFNREDFAACRECYALPCSFVSTAGIHLLDEGNFIDTMTATSAALRRKGLARSEYTHKRVLLLDDGVALLSCRCLRYHADGRLMAEIFATYTVHRGADGWRLAQVLIHGPDQPMLPLGEAL